MAQMLVLSQVMLLMRRAVPWKWVCVICGRCYGCQKRVSLLCWLPAVSMVGCCGRVLLLWTVFAVVPRGAGWRVDGNGQFAGTADRMGMVMSVLAQVLFGDLYGWGVWSVRQQPRLQPSRVFGLGPLGSL